MSTASISTITSNVTTAQTGEIDFKELKAEITK
jgi:hypothetical protein